jgi:hypothetical protein
MSGYIVRSLPSMTVSTSGGVTSNAIGSLDDAQNLGFVFTTTSTGTNTLEVELTDTGTNFQPLFMTSTGTAITLSTSGVTTITAVAFRQMRISTTGAPASPMTVNVSKQIFV